MCFSANILYIYRVSDGKMTDHQFRRTRNINKMQNKRISIALFASLFLLSNILTGQVSFSPDFTFSNETGQLLNNPNFKSRLVVAVADLNNDQLDDIIRLSGGNFLEIQLQDNGRPFSPFYRFAPSDEEQFNIDTPHQTPTF